MAIGFNYLARPRKGETVCGDAGARWDLPGRTVLALADGLGHGPAAHRAASAALDCVAANLERSCAEIFMACNAGLIDTRGAALAVALIDHDSDMLTLASIGNIRSVLLTRRRDFRLGAGCGIVGAGYAWLPPDQVQMEAGDMVVMFSDGIDEIAHVRSCLGERPGSMQSLAEQVLARWGRDNDDATVLAYRHGTA